MRGSKIMITASKPSDLELFKVAVERYASERANQPEPPAYEKSDIERFLKENTYTDDSFKESIGQKCQPVVEHLDAVEYIADVSGRQVHELVQNHSLSELYRLYELCKLFNENFANVAAAGQRTSSEK
jgi:hypothetical protein